MRIGHFFFRFSVCVGLILFVFCLIANFKITNSKLIFFYQGLILKHSCVKYICLIWNFYVYVTMVIMMFFLIFFSWTLSSWCWPRMGRPPSGRTKTQLSQKNKIQKLGFLIHIRFYGSGSSPNSEYVFGSNFFTFPDWILFSSFITMFELLKNYGFEETVLKFDANKFHICQLTNIVLKFWIFLNVSGSVLRIRISIQKDLEFGSNTDSDPRHCPLSSMADNYVNICGLQELGRVKIRRH